MGRPTGALGISIAANLVLVGVTMFLIFRAPTANRDDTSSMLRIMPAVPQFQSLPASQSPAPFRWSKLESTDYPTYVANLRNIGCPEQTIRDIITADIHSLYAVRRDPLERGLKVRSLGESEVQRQLAELGAEETSSLAILLGDKAPSRPLVKRSLNSVMPLAFADIDPTALQLNEAQTQVINQVRQDFQNELSIQDPNDPAYRQRWNTAQRKADDTLRGMLGRKVFIQCQLQASQTLSP